jgi:hypothetical protein
MRRCGLPIYGRDPTQTEERTPHMITKGASVSIHAAAELVNVDVGDLRRWASTGALKIEWQGDLEVVRLDEVTALSDQSWRRGPNRRGEALRARMAGATTDTLSVLDLQQLARDREPGPPKR